MISIFYGTRPEYIKLHLLYTKLKKQNFNVELVKVNQHTSLINSCNFDREIIINETGNRLNNIVKSCLNDVFNQTTLSIVQGDTATAFAIALNSFHSNIPVAHIEAGLRTYDKHNPFPEETYRRCISSIADSHFCVTDLNVKNLKQEGIEKNVFAVGNTVLDNLDKNDTEYGNNVLCTLHRRENQIGLLNWLEEINKFGKQNNNLKVIFIVHPNSKNKINKENYNYINFIDPLHYNELIKILKKTKFVITDSGGLQEEASFFNKKVVICRKTTERPEGLGLFGFLCSDFSNLLNILNEINLNYEVNGTCPYGDGHATDRIIAHISQLYFKEIL
jgi:UDP-N-acetylglucosamine 2-epimerase (non-hydrolysing)